MADYTSLSPFLVYCVVMSITPGPNCTMALVAGANYGIRSAVPLVLGISVGVGIQLAVIGIAFAHGMTIYPNAYEALKVVGAGYLLWLAYQLTKPIDGVKTTKESRPVGFLNGLLFQWINPKAWVTTTGAVVAYIPISSMNYSAVFAVLLSIVAFFCVGVWALFGTALEKTISDTKKLRAFNIFAGLLLALSAIQILLHNF